MPRFVKALTLAVALAVGPATSAAALLVTEQPEKPFATFDGSVYAVLYDGNTVYVGGAFTSATDESGTVTRHHAAAINASTGQLLAWNPNADGVVRAIAAVGGDIALGGEFQRVQGSAHSHLAKVNSTTGAPTSFSGDTNRVVRALDALNGRLYVGGGFTSVNGKARSGLAAFDGNTVTAWNPKATGGAVLSLRAANNKVFAGGTYTAMNGSSDAGHLAALSPSGGGLVSAWDPAITIPVDAIDVDSASVYVGADGVGGRLTAFRADNGAKRWTVRTDGGVQAVTAFGSHIYFGGHFDNVTGLSRSKLAMVNTAGSLQSWAPRANSFPGVHALANNGTKLGVGGAFTKINFISRPHFAQFG
jgi:hypothetical protein